MTITPRILLATAVAALATGGVASAQATAQEDAQITVGAAFTLKAGEKSPFDAGGVPAVRQGKAIPKGYVLVGRTVTIDRGSAGSSGAVILIKCPAGKTVRTIGATGKNGPNLIDNSGTFYRTPHKEVRLAVWSPPLAPKSTGTSYAVCR